MSTANSKDDLPVITLPTYLERLALRTHLPCDNEPVSIILSRPDVMKHLSGLAPPSGWPSDRPEGIWLPSDVANRMADRDQARRETRNLTLNCFIKETGELLGMTGFARMDPVGTPGRKAELGIIFNVDERFARKGYATEAMHASVKYAFEELEGVEEVTIFTNRLNQEMRGWAERTAGLGVKGEVPDEVFGDHVWYSFVRAEWEGSGGICERFERKMDSWKENKPEVV